MIVTCAHCLAEWPEDGPVHYANGEWWCDDYETCADRYFGLLEDTDAV